MTKLSEWISDKPLEPSADSLHELYQFAAKDNPNGRALACLHQPASFLQSISHSDTNEPYLRWTHQELVRAAHAFAQRMHDAGLRQGMRVVVFITSGVEWHIIFRACLELACTFCPLNPTVINNEKETKHLFTIMQPSMIIVQRPELGSKLAQFEPDTLEKAIVKLVLDKDSDADWQYFESFAQRESQADLPHVEHKADDVIALFTTSGTTSLPKGCPITNRVFVSASTSMGQANDMSKENVSCNHLPLNHIFAMNYVHQIHVNGGCVVHPAGTFDAGASLRAIHEEGCTDVPGVPAVVKSLLAHPIYKKEHTESIKAIRLGATKILDEDIKACLEGFGADRLSNGFGMTETGTPFQRIFTLKSMTPYAVVGPGQAVRVCDPDTGKPVPLGERGELHVGGPSVVQSYWLAPGQEVDSPFYDDDFGHWMKTGDQAVMTDNDLAVVGRYKDLIIRGGENVAPTAIEAVLQKDFDLQAEVVGLPDDVAGEVPVAIVKDAGEVPEAKIKETLIQKYGRASALEAIVDVKELGLEDYPKTTTGKVQKNVLKDRLAEHMTREASERVEPQGDILESLIALWTRLLGVSQGTLNAQSRVTEWADSLVLARFPAALRKELGMQINLQEVAEHSEIGAQAEILASRSGNSSRYEDLLTTREGPPDVPRAIQAACEETISTLGLHWEDVEDVLPLYDFQKYFMQRRRPQSNNHRHAWVCEAGFAETRAALESALGQHDMLRTMAVHVDGEPYHIVLRPIESWFKHCITEVEGVESAEELKRLKWNDGELDYAAYPGPMFRVVLAPMGKDRTGLIYMAQHSVFDGISLPFFTNDLDALLSGASDLPQRVPFKAWVESTHNIESSRAARKSVDWHVDRLSGLDKRALFPRQRAPEWFKGDTTGWVDESGRAGPTRKSLDQDGDGVTGLSRACDFPGLSVLKKELGVDPSQVLKTALAVLNCRQTGESVALFAQYQAAREWPFLQPWQAKRMPSAMDVNGPTVQTIVNAVKAQGTIGEMLKTMQQDQEELKNHAAAPFSEVIKGLGEAGQLMVDVWRRQIFNWLPGSSAEFQSMSKVQQVSRTDVGLLWNCKSLEPEKIQIMPSWDDAQLSRAEVEKLLDEFVSLIEDVIRRENWEREVGDLLST